MNLSLFPLAHHRSPGRLLPRVLQALPGVCALFMAMAAPLAAQQPIFNVLAPADTDYAQPEKMTLADFNHDGAADLAVIGFPGGDTTQPRSLEIFLGQGDGTFSSNRAAATDITQCAKVQQLAAYDRASDGSMKLLVLCTDTLQMWKVARDAETGGLYFSSGSSSFHEVVTLPTAALALTIGDFSGTGRPEVAVLEAGSDGKYQTIEMYSTADSCPSCLSGPNGPITLSFTAALQSVVDPSEVGAALGTTVTGDSNKATLFYATSVPGSCGGSLLPLLSQNNTLNPTEIQPIPAPYCAHAIAGGDLLNDRRGGLVLGGTLAGATASSAPGFLLSFEGYGDGTFSPVNDSLTSFDGNAPQILSAGDLQVADLNGDGYPDLIAAGPLASAVTQTSDTFALYLGNGDGTFGAPTYIGPDVTRAAPTAQGHGVAQVAIGNLNVDGSPEVVAVDLIGVPAVPTPAAAVQTFTNRTQPSSLTLTAGTAAPGSDGGPSGFFLQAQVSGVFPGGYVQFFDATTQSWLGSVPVYNGKAVLQITGSGVKFYSASYYGDATFFGSQSDDLMYDFNGSSAPTASSVVLSVNPTQATPGTRIDFTSVVSTGGAQATGTVNFVDTNTGNILTSATLDGSGEGDASSTTIPTGVYNVVAHYNGDSQFLSSDSDPITLTIGPAMIVTTLSLTASPATLTLPATTLLTATIAAHDGSTPTGTVQFREGNTLLATATLMSSMTGSNTATATVTPQAGVGQVVATYIGNATYAQATSNAVTLTVHGGILQFVPAGTYLLAGVPGNGATGGYNVSSGPATAARLNVPNGVATDASGNVYLADELNNIIRKVAPDGSISTVAGTQYRGNVNSTRYAGDGGPATGAYLSNPTAVVADPQGNFYIADYSNNVVRRVDAGTGIITTVAGIAANPGYNGDGPGDTRQLTRPIAVALDTAGNLYIAEYSSNLIRKLDTAGILTTIAGHYGYSNLPVDGQQATAAALTRPEGVAVDAAGTVYVSDTGQNVVRRIASDGTMTRYAGGGAYSSTTQGDGGPARSASLSSPQQLAVDLAGSLYIADTGNNSVRKVDSAGIIGNVVGVSSSSTTGTNYNPAGAPSTVVPLAVPTSVAIGAQGEIYVADSAVQTVVVAGPQGHLLFGPVPQTSAQAQAQSQILTLANAGDAPITFNAAPYTVTGSYTVTVPAMATPSGCDFTAALPVGQRCTLAVTPIAGGSGTGGSIAFNSSAAGMPVVVLDVNANPTATTTLLQTSSNTPAPGDQLLLYGSVSSNVSAPILTGTVSFYDGATLLGSAAIDRGAGYIILSTLAVGPHSITAVYSGDGSFGTSTSAAIQVTVLAPSQTTLTASPANPAAGDPVTLRARATDSNGNALTTGTVTFTDGQTQLGGAPVDGNGFAVYTTSSLSVGMHSITATYNGSSTNATSTSAALNVTVGAASSGSGFDYLLTPSSEPIAIHRGDTGTITFIAQNIGTGGGKATLSCGVLPVYATCSFVPAVVDFTGSAAPQTITLTISTTPNPGSAAVLAPPHALAARGPLAGVMLLP